MNRREFLKLLTSAPLIAERFRQAGLDEVTDSAEIDYTTESFAYYLDMVPFGVTWVPEGDYVENSGIIQQLLDRCDCEFEGRIVEG